MQQKAIEGGGTTRLYVEASGDQTTPPLLFIHGIGCSSRWWDRQFAALADSYFLVRYDLRGHGNSGKPEDAAAYRQSELWADDLAAVISAFGLKTPTLVAWSYGGFVVGDYLSRYGQEHLSGLVLVDTAAVFDGDALRLVGMSDQQLRQPEAHFLLNDLATHAIAAYTGQRDLITGTSQPGIHEIHGDLQTLSIFTVTNVEGR